LTRHFLAGKIGGVDGCYSRRIRRYLERRSVANLHRQKKSLRLFSVWLLSDFVVNVGVYASDPTTICRLGFRPNSACQISR